MYSHSEPVRNSHPSPGISTVIASLGSEDEHFVSGVQVRQASDAPVQFGYQTNSVSESSDTGEYFNAMNNAPKFGTATFMDDESLFSLRSVSTRTPASIKSSPQEMTISDVAGSNLKDSPSIISNIAIETKRLRRTLRNYKRFDDVYVLKHNLFEIRMYNLSQKKRRELGNIIKGFVAEVEEAS